MHLAERHAQSGSRIARRATAERRRVASLMRSSMALACWAGKREEATAIKNACNGKS
jgi:hypothetical protein